MIFGISGYGSNNCHAIFCGAKGLGEGASCENVPVKNKDNRFSFLKGNYIYLSIVINSISIGNSMILAEYHEIFRNCYT